MTEREFWFSQALEDVEGDTWPPDVDTLEADGWDYVYSGGGLIEKRSDGQFYAEGHLRPWHELPYLPEDAVRLAPEGHTDLDAQDRDQSYRRGWSDGRLAERAGAGPLPVEPGVHSDGRK